MVAFEGTNLKQRNIMERMLITTTPSIEGYSIKEYSGIVSSNIVIGTNAFSDIKASFTDVFGGRSGTYQSKMDDMFTTAKEALTEKALELGANAIVGYNIHYQELAGKGKGMLMINATGTACKIEKKF